MSARGDGFGRFVVLSVVAHVLIVAGVVVAVLSMRPKEEPVAIFELVGTPGLPEGPAGAQEGGSDAAAQQGDAKKVENADQVKEQASPDDIPVPGAQVKQESRIAGKAAGTVAAAAGHGSGAGKGLVNGRGGSGNDTLDIGTGGGGGGAPSYMSFWLKRVRQAVDQQWRSVASSARAPNGAPTVVFTIARDGQASRPVVLHSSGNIMVDRMAMRAIQAVGEFPPLPQAWPRGEVKLRYVLEIRNP